MVLDWIGLDGEHSWIWRHSFHVAFNIFLSTICILMVECLFGYA